MPHCFVVHEKTRPNGTPEVRHDSSQSFGSCRSSFLKEAADINFLKGDEHVRTSPECRKNTRLKRGA